MDLKTYLFALSPDQRTVFAESVGTSAKHLTNVSYGYKPLDPKVCTAIEKLTRKKVTRRELRPDDAHLIWPDIKSAA
jgi:DNA-binding transcriptional regulator YdaS (Cro superfamily)